MLGGGGADGAAAAAAAAATAAGTATAAGVETAAGTATAAGIATAPSPHESRSDGTDYGLSGGAAAAHLLGQLYATGGQASASDAPAAPPPPPPVPSHLAPTATTVYHEYRVVGGFNGHNGRFAAPERSGDNYWGTKGIPKHRDERQMNHYFDLGAWQEQQMARKQQAAKGANKRQRGGR